MKTRKFFIVGLIAVLFSGCVVYSFYPLYTEKDLFANDILTGEWFENDEQEVKFTDGDNIWKFEHPFINEKESDQRDSLSYLLTLREQAEGETAEAVFFVHLIELSGQYFLDFYLKDFVEGENMTLADFHVIPVHTFAKLTVEDDRLKINWFDNDWLEKLIRENKIRIHHEETDDLILLTAKPQELQKFVTKYVNSEEAFKDGLEVILQRK